MTAVNCKDDRWGNSGMIEGTDTSDLYPHLTTIWLYNFFRSFSIKYLPFDFFLSFALKNSDRKWDISPTLSDLRSGLLSCSRTDEKPWSATRRVGENHRAGAESVSFSRVCKLLPARVDRLLEHQQVEGDSSFSFFSPSVRKLIGVVGERK